MEFDVVELPGVSVAIASDFANYNYSHFLFDVIPRIDLAKRAGIDLARADRILVPHGPFPFRRMLAELGISSKQLLWSDAPVAYFCETLIAPTFPGVRRTLQPWGAYFLQSHLGKFSGKGGRRLYIPRTTTRRMVNEAELIELLLTKGFEVFDPERTDIDQRQVFAEASWIVGAHGAGLANIVFAQRGARLVEIIPSDHVYPYYAHAARAAGLQYLAVIGTSLGDRGPGAWGPSPFDVVVKLADVISALAELGLDAEPPTAVTSASSSP